MVTLAGNDNIMVETYQANMARANGILILQHIQISLIRHRVIETTSSPIIDAHLAESTDNMLQGIEVEYG